MYASQLLRVLGTFPMDMNNEICAFDTDERKATMKESPRTYTNPFLSDEENDKVNYWNNPELERLVVDADFTNTYADENCANSLPSRNIPSEFFGRATDFYAGRSVLECELPELMVCYKDNAFNVVKDICVDEGPLHEEKGLIDSDNHGVLSNSFPLKENRHGSTVEDNLDTQFLKPEQSKCPSVEDCCVDDLCSGTQLRFLPVEECCVDADLCSGTKEKVVTDLPHPEPTSNHRVVGDNSDDMIKGNLDTRFLNGELMKSSSREESYMNSDISFESEEVCSDLSIPAPIIDCRNMGNLSIVAEIPSQDGQDPMLGKDYEVATTEQCWTNEKGTIESVVPNELKNVPEDGSDKCGVHEINLSVESNTLQNAIDNCGPQNLMQTAEERSISSANLSGNGSAKKVVLLQKDRPSTSLKSLFDFSKNGVIDDNQQPCQSPVEGISRKPVVGCEAQEPDTSHETTNTSNESVAYNYDNRIPTTSSGAFGAENFDIVTEFTLKTQSARYHQDTATDDVKMANQVQRGEGESSFSGLITYSGTIAFSGSISHRSDSSTTSTRSFAFPVLQSEWNSSPVRMVKADRRRGWRHGLLCCRY